MLWSTRLPGRTVKVRDGGVRRTPPPPAAASPRCRHDERDGTMCRRPFALLAMLTLVAACGRRPSRPRTAIPSDRRPPGVSADPTHSTRRRPARDRGPQEGRLADHAELPPSGEDHSTWSNSHGCARMRSGTAGGDRVSACIREQALITNFALTAVLWGAEPARRPEAGAMGHRSRAYLLIRMAGDGPACRFPGCRSCSHWRADLQVGTA